MGQQLQSFFAEAQRLGGLQARVRLAKLTGMAAIQAESIEDAPEVIARFEKALKSLGADFSRPSADAHLPAAALAPARARRFNLHYANLLNSQAEYIHDLKLTANRVTEAAADALEVARASIWLYDDRRTAMECVDLFERDGRKHSSGMRLGANDFPQYFSALETERVIDAADAHTDKRTACFSTPYLQPLGINSMLDVPIWCGTKMVGVVCQEHIGPRRQWLNEEADFAFMIASLVARALDHKKWG